MRRDERVLRPRVVIRRIYVAHPTAERGERFSQRRACFSPVPSVESQARNVHHPQANVGVLASRERIGVSFDARLVAHLEARHGGASTLANAIAPPSGLHHAPLSRPISSLAAYSARPCVTIGRPRAPNVTRVASGAMEGSPVRTSQDAT